MKFLILKYAVTAFIIVLASLPFVTIMVMIWLYIEGQGDEKISNYPSFIKKWD